MDFMWWKSVLLIVALVVVAFLIAVGYGSRRWQAQTTQMRASLEAASVEVEPEVYDSAQLEGLPAPVQRYFRKALKDGQRIVKAVSIEQVGTFNTRAGSTDGRWSPFTATQRVVTRRPGFIWDARIEMFKGLTVRVHDAYISGEGILHAALFGLVPLVQMRGTPEVAHGELMRFFVEGAWYPTALLPTQGVRWEAIDDTSARATLEDRGTTVSMIFRFGEDDLIESAYAEARGREVGGEIVQTPWEGSWSNYETHDGMLVPMEGEVAWLLPEGRRPYWRGRVTEITYERTK